MNGKFQNQYRIPSARATWHDYSSGAYFVTICTKNHECFFGEIVDCTDVCRDVARNVSTMATANNEPIMQLSKTGKFVNENLHKISNHYPYAEIPLFVVMPNHIHAIVFIDGNRILNNCTDVDCRDVARNVSTGRNKIMIEITKFQSLLAVTVRGFKSAITKFTNENKIEFAWQTRFHDRIIRDQDEMNRIADYIENNPARWDMDCFNKQNK